MPDLTSTRLAEEFPGNEWLVADLYDKYKDDPESVDRKWADIFRQLEGESTASSSDAGSAASSATQESSKKEAAATQASEQKSSQEAEKQSGQKQQSSRGSAGSASSSNSAKETTPNTATPADPDAAQRPDSEKPSKKSAPQSTQAGEDSAAKPVAPKKPSTRRSKGSGTKPIPSEPAPASTDEPSEQKQDQVTQLKGISKAIAANMDASLSVPTATTVRAVPAKLLIDNRVVINNHLRRTRGGKVSFTHIIGYAMLKALRAHPSMNVTYDVQDEKPVAVQPAHVNFGLAIDMPRPDGSRALVVPNIKAAEEMSFTDFWAGYDDVVKRARDNKLTPNDYAGTTVSLTNPGGIGTVHSVPRLSKGQACIVGVGALEYPAEFQGTSEQTLNKLAVSKVITLTSTYDHRVIQGAGSGEFLKTIHELLLGKNGFYEEIFQALRIPHQPVRWSADIQVNPEEQINKVARIQQLIHAYRERGHLMASADPLEYRMRDHPDLEIESHGLTLWDLDRDWPTGGFGGKQSLPLRNILGVLRDTYCRNTGIEYMHIQSPEERRWFQDEIEHPYEKPSRDEQFRILGRLNAAEAFETFLQTKFVGQKRFSLEGGESLIPLLDVILSEAADEGLDEVTIGMAHRGRLNVLANIAGKTYAQIFREFEGRDFGTGSGDVKYHLGTRGEFTSDRGNSTSVYLAANPSHLEAVNPVLEGVTRAMQDRLDRGSDSLNSFSVLPLLVHGDAAFAGQGVVMETLNLSQLRGYRTGGTIHVVVNNQVGFTTAPQSARSMTYCTDMALAIQAPVFHVNGDDPESVARVADLAFRYRQRFNKDVVIDLVCYRRRGHNEGDDPSMTQPKMYNLIEAKRSTRKLYTENLVGRGDITQEEADQALQDFRQRLERVFTETNAAQTQPVPTVGESSGALAPTASDGESERPSRSEDDTAISAETLAHIGEVHTNIPESFTPHPKLKSLLEKRAKMAREGGIDWGFAEIAAFGSLLMEGTEVRMSGQDSRRGTFVQRHAVFHDRENGDEWYPLKNLTEDQGRLFIYDSLLSEFAALGFEYGYSVENPNSLVLWEAQFGDFVNGAQTIIDEFVATAEQKWGQSSSVVMLLPHGYEGQGPDHSSGRPERFLQLCAENNMTVVIPSTGANYFHLLRRQAVARPRRPLIVFSPKQLLRLKAAANTVEDFTEGTFQKVIGDSTVDKSKVKRVLIVSGRLYYDLEAVRAKHNDETTAIVRLEQLYPMPVEELQAELDSYPQDAEFVYAQDEPFNQGPWPFMFVNFLPLLTQELDLISRAESAATSVGQAKRHAKELDTLLEQAFPHLDL
ncbi:multifunctional oxoglutarate decarboxylase/oxoglutarate dehydrogenase thiamine pyrophosphate-binding subunit/dihydrolipoyllysine-residue succinyltransferase subunit [Nesterenkonia aerolata]|uniref:Multifunctional oxoglutarate decarboxylase/oxoglutarate dehydrogenase thiamine pyrophosphate-binding subunit/dihydrolipoyllysine-residue succinyltransferase subunit n=1 Tax=Nesterenkonia aerolata TaxID=3074079 RepID=A0ABU2DV86_9MICC|nr:multifunctional oxoglutarate decarboxylase/oxoglutarate dehydrogenase thiamine pyrophosphate-binding subunit/dihydrolipoyllysine-residue succinyltransferase subunit [Nesterenkonia sp. LY-0111]MDR8020185.1 multifunctional oxoglutarate decarboxylase/oxoglutarate dehydrogenase thiamine pyrophosphate-binding subunit/dihydrolipoyllysine-residue succinyltransferase subunit [Nesterenkonia sp. LY-0111]